MNDEELKNTLKEQLYWDDFADDSDIDIEVDDGNITLKGSVPTYRGWKRAAEMAWKIIGTKSVINKLDVNYIGPIPTDEEIAENIKNIYKWDPDLRSSNFNIIVENGKVTLKGSVDKYWKKILAQEEASLVVGVVEIHDQIAIVPSTRYEDKKIANTIIKSLNRNSYVNTEDVNVRVKNGEVILTGNVPSGIARIEAMESAINAPGVVSINNALNIRP